MSLITVTTMGRFGNQLFQYAFARAYAEKHGFDFQCDPWLGSELFKGSQDKRITKRLPRKSEIDLIDGESNFEFYGYAQCQKCMIYTREQVRKWFEFKDGYSHRLSKTYPPDEILGHRRVGDYLGYGYPVVSEASYRNACQKFGHDPAKLKMITEENPTKHPDFTGPISFVPDFYRLMNASILLRGNSCFSWWAGTLGDGKIYSPVIDNLVGGREHDVEFVEGNHPKFANLGFITDLHLKQ